MAAEVWAAGDAYEPYVGRWSRPVAKQFLDWLAVPPGQQWLDIGCGTGALSASVLANAAPARLAGIDPSAAFLEHARSRMPDRRASFKVADAQDLPFGDKEFDLVICQFGAMFFQDKVKANREARRVLRDGGRYLSVIWDRLERNPAGEAVHKAMATAFPDDPPGFLARTPWGYGDPAAIEHDLLAAGFTDIEFETVPLDSAPGTTTRVETSSLVAPRP